MPPNPDPARAAMMDKPMADMSLDQWLAYLEKLHPTTIDLGLERIRQVAARLALDFSGCRVVTVGGTNGKGTSVALLSHILQANGRRTGVYTSPHLLRYNERVRLDGVLAGDHELCEAFAEVERARQGVSLTYFEFGTLAALLLFARAPLDTLILEVGLGGRLDAVNIVDADVAVLTNVALDHQDWLGDTREAIGREKAGIFRAGRPAVYGETDMPASVAEAARALDARLYRQGRDFHWRQDADTGVWHWRGTDREGRAVELNDLPACRFTMDNVAGVLQALLLLGENVPRGVLEASLREASLAGRFQRFERGGHSVVLDVAHNPHAARNLAAMLRREFPDRRFRLVIAMLADKDRAGVVEALADIGEVIWYIGEIGGERGAPAEILYNHVLARGGARASARGSILEAFQAAEAEAEAEDVVVVTGSFYTVTAVLSHLAGSGADAAHEPQGRR